MLEILQREFTYLWYYFSVQFEQIFPYWVCGLLVGSAISVFGRQSILRIFSGLQGKKIGLLGLFPAALLGIASPICMAGTIPIAAAFSKQGMREDWLAAFMMSSILLNPQLIIYSAALGSQVLAVRLISCVLCGILAGVLVFVFFRNGRFFHFAGFGTAESRDVDPNYVMRFLKNLGRNVKATALYFLLGIVLSALFQRYVPLEAFAHLFGRNEGFGVLMAATIGVPLYACGGGTIPLLQQWLADGMSLGSAAAFMVSGPATKITNLSSLKNVLGIKHFLCYLAFVILYATINGIVVDLFF